MLKNVEGIIIRSIDYGETNKIVTVFSRENGKIGMMARGAKKPNSRLSFVSQLFTYGNYLYYAAKGLGTMSQGEVIQSFRSIREDVFKTAYVACIAELTDKLSEEKKTDPYLFELLYQSLHYINEGLDPEVIMFIFETKMLAVAGIAPKLDGCVSCGREEGIVSFSIREGGFLCDRCVEIDAHHIPVSEAVRKLLKLFLHFDLKRLGSISLKERTKDDIRLVLKHYYDTYSGLHLKSKRFLEQMDRLK